MKGFSRDTPTRVRDTNGSNDLAYLKELGHRNDPEALFESQPSLHSNPSALAEYVKALAKVDRLDESELVRTLLIGIAGAANPQAGEESMGGPWCLLNERGICSSSRFGEGFARSALLAESLAVLKGLEFG